MRLSLVARRSHLTRLLRGSATREGGQSAVADRYGARRAVCPIVQSGEMVAGTATAGMFERYVGIDYSGAETPMRSLSGLRVYVADAFTPAIEVLPTSRPGKYWSRRGLAEWLVELLAADTPTLVGIDHAFSFPLRYFKQYQVPLEWRTFLDDFQQHWPTDEDIYVDFVRDGVAGNGAARRGMSRWKRIADQRARGAKSVFHFDAPGSVAKSTHSGLPWLRFIDRQCARRVHFWPFDGWEPPPGRSVVAEIYPAIWSRNYPREFRNDHQHDAYTTATWLRDADGSGSLRTYFHPALDASEETAAATEGWILGVP